jgi:hypothetical protein
MTAPTFDGSFAHHWTAEILPNRPMILPARHYVYPAAVDEVELGALEVLIQSGNPPPQREGFSLATQPFLATCALGFRDPATPTGIWAMPDPDWLCAASGGYAYLIDTTEPETFIHLRYRPVLEIRTFCPGRASRGAKNSAQSLMDDAQSLTDSAQSSPCDAQSANEGLTLFISHHTILAWGAKGEAWESERLSAEGITISGIEVEDGVPTLRGFGWDMRTDKDTPFALDLGTGVRIPA